MCLFCNWAAALDSAGLSASRRKISRGGTVFAATAVDAASPTFAAATQQTKERPMPAPQDGQADWLFENGFIHTVNAAQPTAEAVAVRGDRIVYVGDQAGAAAWRGPKTRIVDLAGRMLIPGFVDAHDHLATLGVTKLGVNVGGLKGKATVLDAIRAWIARQPAEAPLRGFGWVLHDTFGEELPRREWLDEATGDRPMYLLSADIHETWFNTAAMKAAGLDATSRDPDPGKQYYARNPDGTPLGLAIEGAALPILIACGMTAPETVRESQKLTIDRAPSQGMTTYMDCGFLLNNQSGRQHWVIEDLVARDQAGELPIRIVATVYTRSDKDDPQAVADELVDWNQRFRSDHVSVGACKMWTDGTFIAGTAKLLEPFADGAPGGRMFFTQAHIEAQIKAVQKAGFDMHVHADGDGSVRTVLDAFEAVQKRLGLQGRRHTICHISLVHPDDLPRFRKLGLVVNGTPLWATDYNGVDYDRYQRKLGARRFEERLLAYGDVMRSGATYTIGADLGGVDVDEIPPLMQLEAAVTRQRPGRRNDNVMVARQRMSVGDAIKAYTINGAHQLHMEDQIGSIEVGKKADLVVLGADLFAVDPYDIHRVPVLLTLMDGKARHDKLKA
jgi:predicted amidohydrolase YtcJ